MIEQEDAIVGEKKKKRKTVGDERSKIIKAKNDYVLHRSQNFYYRIPP